MFNDDYLLCKTLVFSIALHFLLLRMGTLSFRLKEKPPVEIDITDMGTPAIAPASFKRGPAPKPPPDQKAIPDPVPAKLVAPEPESSSPAPPAAPEEYALGGSEASTLSHLPHLLNLADLQAILRRFYPEPARSQGREATVVLDIHIDTQGHVISVDIVQSGGMDFDDAARKAVLLLRFSPAFLGTQPVAVKMRQAIQFKLEE